MELEVRLVKIEDDLREMRKDLDAVTVYLLIPRLSSPDMNLRLLWGCAIVVVLIIGFVITRP